MILKCMRSETIRYKAHTRSNDTSHGYVSGSLSPFNLSVLAQFTGSLRPL